VAVTSRDPARARAVAELHGLPRWYAGREATPWYPTMGLFRQEARGKWQPVFARLAQALRERVPTT
jgi:hypothetical protein